MMEHPYGFAALAALCAGAVGFYCGAWFMARWSAGRAERGACPVCGGGI